MQQAGAGAEQILPHLHCLQAVWFLSSYSIPTWVCVGPIKQCNATASPALAENSHAQFSSSSLLFVQLWVVIDMSLNWQGPQQPAHQMLTASPECVVLAL